MKSLLVQEWREIGRDGRTPGWTGIFFYTIVYFIPWMLLNLTHWATFWTCSKKINQTLLWSNWKYKWTAIRLRHFTSLAHERQNLSTGASTIHQHIMPPIFKAKQKLEPTTSSFLGHIHWLVNMALLAKRERQKCGQKCALLSQNVKSLSQSLSQSYFSHVLCVFFFSDCYSWIL